MKPSASPSFLDAFDERSRKALLWIAGVIASCVLYGFFGHLEALENLNILCSLATLIAAGVIGWSQAGESMKAKWPKRLTVEFLHPEDSRFPGRVALRCRMVYLAGESDIRAWAQQIGSQMAGVPRLDFDPGILQAPGRDDRLHDGTPCRHYAVTFRLTALPDAAGKPEARAIAERLQRGEARVWDYSGPAKTDTWTNQP
jgi:hypothetical protein